MKEGVSPTCSQMLSRHFAQCDLIRHPSFSVVLSVMQLKTSAHRGCPRDQTCSETTAEATCIKLKHAGGLTVPRVGALQTFFKLTLGNNDAYVIGG